MRSVQKWTKTLQKLPEDEEPPSLPFQTITDHSAGAPEVSPEAPSSSHSSWPPAPLAP